MNNDPTRGRWICCQIGAREHYAVPRVLQGYSALEALVTDVWVPMKHPLSILSHTLGERYHRELGEAEVCAFNLGSISFELRARIAGLHGWEKIIARNDWFQKVAVSKLEQTMIVDPPCTLFAYSYAAREIFLYARKRGWRTVLGQIDPGPVEERIVAKLYAENPTQRGK